jgi:hypothetical protein
MTVTTATRTRNEYRYKPVALAGGLWFLTVDELESKRETSDEPLDTAFARLSAALATAMALRKAGRGFVVAPLPTRAGQPAARTGGRFGAALYPISTGSAGTSAISRSTSAASAGATAAARTTGRPGRACAQRSSASAPADPARAAAAGPPPRPVGT